MSEIAVLVQNYNKTEEAKALAHRLSLSVLFEESDEFDLYLCFGEEGLFLMGEGTRVMGDFSNALRRLKPANLNGEMLVKASGIKKLAKKGKTSPPLAIDATAGLGEDSLLLAAAGFHVIMFERDPVIAALLRDAIHRAKFHPELEAIMERMELHEGDSISEMRKLSEGGTHPELVLLDPMFPGRSKSGLVKKKFQLIHGLEEPCKDEEELFAAAKALKPLRIIVKRPLKGPFLAMEKPGFSIQGKTIRYDGYI